MLVHPSSVPCYAPKGPKSSLLAGNRGWYLQGRSRQTGALGHWFARSSPQCQSSHLRATPAALWMANTASLHKGCHSEIRSRGAAAGTRSRWRYNTYTPHTPLTATANMGRNVRVLCKKTLFKQMLDYISRSVFLPENILDEDIMENTLVKWPRLPSC